MDFESMPRGWPKVAAFLVTLCWEALCFPFELAGLAWWCFRREVEIDLR